MNFYKNGVALGDVTSFNIRNMDMAKEELFACVTFYNPGDSATILSTSAPSDTTEDDDEDTKERGSKRQKVHKKGVKK
jgi:hypothetical protein